MYCRSIPLSVCCRSAFYERRDKKKAKKQNIKRNGQAQSRARTIEDFSPQRQSSIFIKAREKKSLSRELMKVAREEPFIIFLRLKARGDVAEKNWWIISDDISRRRSWHSQHFPRGITVSILGSFLTFAGKFVSHYSTKCCRAATFFLRFEPKKLLGPFLSGSYHFKLLQNVLWFIDCLVCFGLLWAAVPKEMSSCRIRRFYISLSIHPSVHPSPSP